MITTTAATATATATAAAAAATTTTTTHTHTLALSISKKGRYSAYGIGCAWAQSCVNMQTRTHINKDFDTVTKHTKKMGFPKACARSYYSKHILIART